MNLPPRSAMRNVAIAALTLAASAAQAHTGHANSGLFEGLSHPLGLDHLLAMLAVGVWSVAALPSDKTAWGPITFLLALLASAALGVTGVTLPWQEQLISLSVVLFGLMLLFAKQRLPMAVGLGLIAAAATLHGLAHGAEAPPTGLAAYAMGFILTTTALHFCGVAAAQALRRFLASRVQWAIGSLGLLLSGSGAYLFSQL